METITQRVYICMCIESGNYQGKEGQIKIFNDPMHETYGPDGNGDTSFMGTWALVEAKDITLEYTPLDQSKLAADMIAKYEAELSKHRAAAFRREQFLEGRIAKYHALTYKGDGEALEGQIIPTCTKPREEIDADDAEIIEPADEKDDFPF